MEENTNGYALSEERIKGWFGQNKSADYADPRIIYWQIFNVSFLRSFLNYTEDRNDEGYIYIYIYINIQGRFGIRSICT